MRKPMMIVALAAVLSLVTAAPVFAGGTALDDYIARPEPSTAWKLASKTTENGVTTLDIELTSQTWRGIDLKHHLWAFRPEKVELPDLAVLIVTGGSGKDAKRYATPLIAQTGALVVILDNIPNQPIWGMKEDDLIAHTFEQFNKTGETDWPLLFPMTKAAVKAMDAISDVTEKELGTRVSRFIVSGASKRGWTTWLTASVDARVVGIVPIVFDNLNFEPQMKAQIDSWGRFSEQIEDYTRRGLQQQMQTPRGKQLTTWVDPWTYRDRWQDLPKLIINGSNDRYWTLESLNHYWGSIGKNKSVLYCPNEGHGIQDVRRVLSTAGAFVRRVGANRQLPKMEWTWDEAGGSTSIHVSANEEPAEVRVWVAKIPEGKKDFRDAKWESVVMDAASELASGSRKFSHTFAEPASGYVAFFAEAVFDEGEGHGRFTLSSQVRVLAPRGATAATPATPATGPATTVTAKSGKKAKLY